MILKFSSGQVSSMQIAVQERGSIERCSNQQFSPYTAKHLFTPPRSKRQEST